MDRVIIINPVQFGQSTDYLKYAQYLAESYKVKYFCLYQGKKVFKNENISISYTDETRFKSIGRVTYILRVLVYLLLHRGIVLCANFSGCRFLKFFSFWRRMAVNIRTVSVEEDEVRTRLMNESIRKDALPFDRIIMISEGGARQLRLPMEKVRIVSLGADIISSSHRVYDSMRLLYVGTLTGRRLLDTVIGLKRYISETGEKVSYDIVGDGQDFDEISNYVRDNGLEDNVKMHGQIPYDELSVVYEHCNIGVSYVPINSAYEYQPPTKTFEYISSGLYCIATDTYANREVITVVNGLLIKDSAEDFYHALQDTRANIHSLDEAAIRLSGEPYSWRHIVNDQLIPALI